MKESKKFAVTYYVLIISAFALSGIGIISPFYIKTNYIIKSLPEMAYTGDWLSGITTPFFGLASIFLIMATLLAQKEQLKAQQDDLNLTRKEFIQQNKTLSRQRFENTFFQLIALHNEIVRSIQYNSTSSGLLSGRKCFQQLYFNFKNYYIRRKDSAEKNNEFYNNIQFGHDFLVEIYDGFFAQYQDDMGHFFRNLYHIVRLIDTSEGLEDEERKNYARIIRAQLSTYELLFIFYNAISKNAYEKFKPLIDRYDLLQNMNFGLLIEPEHIEIYKNITQLKDNITN